MELHNITGTLLSLLLAISGCGAFLIPQCVHGTCVWSMTVPHHTCRCDPGYSGTLCDQDACHSQPCGSHGTCSLVTSEPYYRCRCDSGYSGTNCIYEVCRSQTCGAHGTCNTTSVYPYFRCSCEPGYTGRNCDNGPCTHIYCGSHGTCVEESFSPFYSCRCAAGYSGDRCEHDACYGVTCSGQGTCSLQSVNPHYKCTCNHGFIGTHCESESHWSDWSRLISCSVTCGSGLQSRQRACVGSPTGCVGNSQETATCNLKPCDPVGTWTSWSEWTGCGMTCGAGTQTRYRACYKPEPSAANCAGNNTETQLLSLPACSGCRSVSDPDHGHVMVYSLAVGGMAMFTCADGFELQGPNSIYCLITMGWSDDVPKCVPAPGSWSDWSSWTSSGETCGSETVSRYRLCNKPNIQAVCAGRDSDFYTNSLAPCPVDQASCPFPGQPINGGVTVPRRNVGSTATYHCQQGYSLRGLEERYCLDTLTWSGKEPECVTVCPYLAHPAHGFLKPNVTDVDSIVTYVCLSGYLLRGSATRVCQLNGSWSGDDVTCVLP